MGRGRLILLLLISYLCDPSVGFSQNEKSHLTLSVIQSSDEGIPNLLFVLYHGSDSITSGTTDANGQIEWEIALEFQSEYELICLNAPNSSKKYLLTFDTDPYPMEYTFEIKEMSSVRKKYEGQVAYYQLNDVKKIDEFEVEQILGIIKNHPEICIEFSQTIVHSESDKIAAKRKSNFLKFLEENGVDMSCIRFSDRVGHLRAFDADQRSRIQGAIYSLDSKCD